MYIYDQSPVFTRRVEQVEFLAIAVAIGDIELCKSLLFHRVTKRGGLVAPARRIVRGVLDMRAVGVNIVPVFDHCINGLRYLLAIVLFEYVARLAPSPVTIKIAAK